MVGHYPTIKLIGREHIPHQKRSFHPTPCRARSYPVLDTISGAYPKVEGRLLTCYSPVRRSCTPKGALPLDLHVLSTPPAFVLSQDQTLHRKPNPNRTNPNKKTARIICPKNNTQKTTRAHKTIPSTINDTLLSSQKSDAHRTAACLAGSGWGQVAMVANRSTPTKSACGLL